MEWTTKSIGVSKNPVSRLPPIKSGGVAMVMSVTPSNSRDITSPHDKNLDKGDILMRLATKHLRNDLDNQRKRDKILSKVRTSIVTKTEI